MATQQTMLASDLRVVERWLSGQGADVEDALQAAGIPMTALAKPRSRIPTAHVGALLTQLSSQYPAEDIGLAEPEAQSRALAAWQAYERLGSPEGDLAIAGLVIYLATAPKSNAAYKAFKVATKAAALTGSLRPPAHILNAPTKLMKQLGYGADYAYDHDDPDGFSGQNCFPDGMARQVFYQPVERGYEREIAKRLAYWDRLRASKQPVLETGKTTDEG